MLESATSVVQPGFIAGTLLFAIFLLGSYFCLFSFGCGVEYPYILDGRGVDIAAGFAFYNRIFLAGIYPVG